MVIWSSFMVWGTWYMLSTRSGTWALNPSARLTRVDGEVEVNASLGDGGASIMVTIIIIGWRRESISVSDGCVCEREREMEMDAVRTLRMSCLRA